MQPPIHPPLLTQPLPTTPNPTTPNPQSPHPPPPTPSAGRGRLAAHAQRARRGVDGQRRPPLKRLPVFHHLQVGAPPRLQAHGLWPRRGRWVGARLVLTHRHVLFRPASSGEGAEREGGGRGCGARGVLCRAGLSRESCGQRRSSIAPLLLAGCLAGWLAGWLGPAPALLTRPRLPFSLTRACVSAD